MQGRDCVFTILLHCFYTAECFIIKVLTLKIIQNKGNNQELAGKVNDMGI